MFHKPHELSEWRKVGVAFTVGVLFGTVVWVWLVPWLEKII